jgi:hypothetical protein
MTTLWYGSTSTLRSRKQTNESQQSALERQGVVGAKDLMRRQEGFWFLSLAEPINARVDQVISVIFALDRVFGRVEIALMEKISGQGLSRQLVPAANSVFFSPLFIFQPSDTFNSFRQFTGCT